MEEESKKKKEKKREKTIESSCVNKGPKIKQGDMKVCLKAKVNGDGPHQISFSKPIQHRKEEIT